MKKILLLSFVLISFKMFGSLPQKVDKSIIAIGLHKSDFVNTEYVSNTDCALARAIKRYCKNNNISVRYINVGVDNFYLNSGNYVIIDSYGAGMFQYDYLKSKFCSQNNVIRTCLFKFNHATPF